MSHVIIDTHCHPQFPQFDTDRDAVIRRALDAGVGMVCVGTDLEMSKKAIELAQKHEGVWASVGLHPNDNLSEEYDNAEYKELAANSKAVAIGEVGLDYYRTTDGELKKMQKKRFEQQLGLAMEVNKPLIIHCRDAHEDMLELLGSKLQDSNSKLRGVIHSFTGTYEDARRYVELGFYIGLNGIITFARQYDETVKNIPVDNILLETDSPYLTPTPYRGKRNEPAYVLEIAKYLASLRDQNFNEFRQEIRLNTKRLLSI